MQLKKIGLVTWHYYCNFGSALQAYALQTYLLNQGFDVRFINYRNEKYGRISWNKEVAKSFISNIFMYSNGKTHNRLYYPFLSFRSNYLRETRSIYDRKILPRNAKKYDVVICGSDQIWAPNVFNEVYFLDFVPENTRKISYAASIGLDNIPTEYIAKYRELLKKFDYISVREKTGEKLLKEKCGIQAVTVLDPTLILDIDTWRKIEIPAKEISEPYIFCYFLNTNNLYQETVVEYAKKSRLKIIGISAKKDDLCWMNTAGNVGPCEFLNLIHRAEVVFTDSYHGTIFSMLYHKEFYLFERFSEADPVNQNSRIYQLDTWFDIKERILKGHKKPTDCRALDYDKFEIDLASARKISEKFLEEALG